MNNFTNLDEEKPHYDLGAIFPEMSFGINTQLIGIAQMDIGKFGVIGDDVWLNVAIRNSDEKRLRIGDFSCIGRHSVISALTYVELGDFALLGPRVFIADSNHGFSAIHLPYVQQPSTGGGPLIIEENCWIGVNAAILGDILIGRGSVIGANTVVTTDIPPFSMVVGAPGHIIKMYNPLTCNWEPAASKEDRERILAAREQQPLPTREEYRHILRHTNRLKRIDPCAAGYGQHI